MIKQKHSCFSEILCFYKKLDEEQSPKKEDYVS